MLGILIVDKHNAIRFNIKEAVTMGLLLDIVKDLPISAVMREKILQLEADILKVKEEKAELKEEFAELKEKYLLIPLIFLRNPV
jgi:hypothetical protein